MSNERTVVAIYARVSGERQETEMQLTDLRKYVERMGWTAIEYVEKASSVKHRPIFEQLLRQAQCRTVLAHRPVREVYFRHRAGGIATGKGDWETNGHDPIHQRNDFRHP